MDLHQLRTFVAVARERSITRASEVLHLSQPAVSAHVKAIEDALGLTLFDRTARGMSLTHDGERLLVKAERTLEAHRELMGEATRIKGQVSGKLRLGAGSNSDNEAIGALLTTLSELHPDVEVVLEHGRSVDVVAGIRGGRLDAGFYNQATEPEPGFDVIDMSHFGIWLAAPPGVATAGALDWSALEALPWIYPPASACCGRAAEGVFEANRIRPRRILSVDREDVTRSLIAGGIGVGLLHEPTAKSARDRGEVELLLETPARARVVFAHLASRADDPLVSAAGAIIRARSSR